jgi:hypothetical protein
VRQLPPLTGLPKHSVNQGSTAVDEDTSPACGIETMVSIVGTSQPARAECRGALRVILRLEVVAVVLVSPKVVRRLREKGGIEQGQKQRWVTERRGG